MAGVFAALLRVTTAVLIIVLTHATAKSCPALLMCGGEAVLYNYIANVRAGGFAVERNLTIQKDGLTCRARELHTSLNAANRSAFYVMGTPNHASEGATWRFAALRRFVAGLCMLALLAVGFAHCVHHLNTSLPSAASQVVDKPDATPEAPYEAGLIVEHCLGCTIIAVMPSNDCNLTVACALSAGIAKADVVQPHDLSLELPPPKSST